jgi:hypothetical protein
MTSACTGFAEEAMALSACTGFAEEAMALSACTGFAEEAMALADSSLLPQRTRYSPTITRTDPRTLQQDSTVIKFSRNAAA